MTERVGCNRGGFRGVDTHTAYLGCDARFKLLEGCAGSFPVVRLAQFGQLFEECVYGGSQSTREQAALVACEKRGFPAFGSGCAQPLF
jgi:hypothetical protein